MDVLQFDSAIRLLYTQLAIDAPKLVGEDEYLAIITHWLKNPSRPPIYGNLKMLDEWSRLLSTYKSLNKLSNWQGEPFDTGKRLRISANNEKTSRKKKAKFTFIELFAGIGGFRLAMESLGGCCLFASEWENSAKQTYFRNFEEYPFGDIRKFTNEKIKDRTLRKLIPDHDVLTAGFPCQPFSSAGLPSRKHYEYESGFDCVEQGNLFYDIIRIAKVKRPAVLFLENVKNIVTHDKKRTFEEIRTQIEDNLKYSFTYKVVDASGIVPQKRERCYIVCFRDKKVEFEFPTFPSMPLPLSSILEKEPEAKYTISDKLWSGHQSRTLRNKAKNNGFAAVTADLNKPANTVLARYGKDGKECLIPQEDQNPRLLTPREVARLQGFPEEYKLYENGARPYRQLGNSVVVPVIRKIAEKFLKDYLRGKL